MADFWSFRFVEDEGNFFFVRLFVNVKYTLELKYLRVGLFFRVDMIGGRRTKY